MRQVEAKGDPQFLVVDMDVYGNPNLPRTTTKEMPTVASSLNDTLLDKDQFMTHEMIEQGSPMDHLVNHKTSPFFADCPC